MFGFFEPASWMIKKKRVISGETFWYYTTVQNRIQAEMIKDQMKTKGYKAKITKKNTKTFGEEYDVWAKKH